MGFLDLLKGGLSFIPGVGPALSAVTSVLGKQQEGKAKGAVDTANVTQGQDRNAISLYQAKQAAENAAAQTDLQRQQFGANEQGRNAKNALMSALLGGNLPRTSINVPGIKSATVSGGLMDALKNNPEALASLATLKGQANSSLASGPKFTGGATVAPPSLTSLPDTGGGNNFLNTLAQIGQLAGAGMSAYKPKQKPGGTDPMDEDYG
jgi:hypothetical protein